MNPYAGGGSNNIYRCFVDLAFRIVTPKGSIGLIHEDGHLAETKGGDFRRNWYARIVKHFNFSNQITTKNFSEVLHTKFFSLNVYRGKSAAVQFDQFTNAFLAQQVDESYGHDGTGEVSGIKLNGRWDTRAHRNRIFTINDEFLNLSSAKSDVEISKDDSPVLYQFISTEVRDAFLLTSKMPSLSESGVVFQSDGLLHESGAQDSNLILKETRWADDANMIVLSSPTIFCGNPLAKTPRRICRVPQDYDPIDLVLVSDDYRPRANYHLVRSSIDTTHFLDSNIKCNG
jgi:hypothetical protein